MQHIPLHETIGRIVQKNSLHNSPHESEQQQRLTLASASPRRRELLHYLTPHFAVLATQGEDEDRAMPDSEATRLPPFPLDMLQHPTLLAWRKVMAAREAGASGIILGADTIVVVERDVLNKPRDAAEAHTMLRRLAGRAHHVYTGVVALADNRDGNRPVLHLALEAAEVTMTPLLDSQIAEYVATGEPLDKAGAYGIQGLGGRLVERVTGSYTCVVGLPIVTTHQVLTAVGLIGLADPVAAFKLWLADHRRTPPPCTAP